MSTKNNGGRQDGCRSLWPHIQKNGRKESTYISDEIVDTLICQIESQQEKEQAHTTLPDPIDAIKGEMQRRGLSNNDLKPCIGSSGNICAIFKRRRPLSLRMIRNLHNFLKIPAEILIQPYDCHG